MAEVSTAGLSQAEVLALIAANTALSFVNGGTPITLANLMTNYPAGSAYANKYAVVSNLYNGVDLATAGGVQEVVRCRYDVTNNAYRWIPQRQDYSITRAETGVLGSTTNVNLIPLVTPPTVRLSGTLLGALNIVPDVTNAWVGLRWRTIQNSTLGVFVTTITNLIGSNVTLLGNTTRDIDYTAAGYYTT